MMAFKYTDDDVSRVGKFHDMTQSGAWHQYGCHYTN